MRSLVGVVSAKHTAGPWRWELNEECKSIHLVGGKPQFDLTILEPIRWGMGRAGLMIRDTAHDGMNIMHKLHERRDWIAPFPGRAHHANWCADVTHPDMRLIAAAPDLLAALQTARECIYTDRTSLADCHMSPVTNTLDEDGAAGVAEYDAVLSTIDAAIAKATGASS